MTVGLTTCPDCDAEYNTESMDESETGSIQLLVQRCPSCDDRTEIGIVNYPSHRYEVFGPAVGDDTCGRIVNRDGRREKCGAVATYRLHEIGEPVSGRCDEHIEQFRLDAFDL